MPVYELVNPKWNEKSITVLCDCLSDEHEMRFYFMLDDLDWAPSLSVDFHLSSSWGVFRRLWYAVRFVFGYRSRYGPWAEICLGPDDAHHIIRFLRGFVTECETGRGRHDE